MNPMGIDLLPRPTPSPDDDPATQLIGLLGEQTDSPGDMTVEHDRYIVEESRNVQPFDVTQEKA